jgi:hypothetical protein
LRAKGRETVVTLDGEDITDRCWIAGEGKDGFAACYTWNVEGHIFVCPWSYLADDHACVEFRRGNVSIITRELAEPPLVEEPAPPSAAPSWAAVTTEGRMPAWLHCQEYGHEWEPRHQEHYYLFHPADDGEDWIERLGLACRHCGEERWQGWQVKTITYFRTRVAKSKEESQARYLASEQGRQDARYLAAQSAGTPWTPKPGTELSGPPERPWWRFWWKGWLVHDVMIWLLGLGTGVVTWILLERSALKWLVRAAYERGEQGAIDALETYAAGLEYQHMDRAAKEIGEAAQWLRRRNPS